MSVELNADEVDVLRAIATTSEPPTTKRVLLRGGVPPKPEARESE